MDEENNFALYKAHSKRKVYLRDFLLEYALFIKSRYPNASDAPVMELHSQSIYIYLPTSFEFMITGRFHKIPMKYVRK